MKYLLYILLFSFSQTITSQSNDSEYVFWSVIDFKLYPETLTDVGYLKKVDFGMLTLHLNDFKEDSTQIYYSYKPKKEKVDSLNLTKREKKFLITELNASENFEWNLSVKKNLKQVKENDKLNFLKEDKNRELKIISKPIFLRNNSIALVFSAHLCCGDFYGYSSLAFYKKINNKWVEWIVLSSGNF